MMLPPPRPSSRAVLRASGCLAAMALLSACAGGQHISASQEASQYQEYARGNYVAPGPASDPWGPYVHEASDRFDVPERWIREVMRVESGGHTEMGGMPITSQAGAMGLMQVMPATYDELRLRYTLGSDPYDPHNSILAGAAYIRELYDLYGSPGFLAAYNAGPGRLDDYLTRNRPLPDETRRYVAKIGPRILDSFPNKRSTAEMYAMNSVPSSIPAGPRYAPAPQAVAVAPAPAPTPPVEVAYAPPSGDGGGDGVFDPPPGWTPPRGAMSRLEVAAYVPPPSAPPPPAPPPPASYAVADATPPSRFTPAPVPAQDDEVAMPRLASPAAPAPAPRSLAAIPTPPEPPPARAPQAQFASLPEPPRPVAPPMVQTASAFGYVPSRRETGLHFLGTANAAPAPAYRGEPGQWAIQVGAFGNEGLAQSAVGSAREQAGPVLSGARQMVAGVREPHGTLYRARLTGLSRESATEACQRLRGHGSCIVLSPDAQS